MSIKKNKAASLRKLHIQEIGLLNKISTFFVIVCYLTSMSIAHVNAMSTKDLSDILNGYAYYNSNDTTTDCGVSPVSGAAAEILKKSALDPKWQEVILSSSSEAGVDPVFMAALLFQENRSWPEYRDGGWPANPTRGSGPWQITSNTWPASAGDYETNSQKVVESTKVAAFIAKAKGATTGMNLGWITDDFGKGTKDPSIARTALNYNAGGATYRVPGVSDYKSPGRQWYKGSEGPWDNSSPNKDEIIDNYIVGVVYLYYLITTGQNPALSSLSSDDFALEAIAKKDEILALKTTSAGTSTSATTSGSTVIALDPGHGGNIAEYVDSVTGLKDRETNNVPEGDDVMDVALQVKSALESKGYQVVLLRQPGGTTTNKRQRVDAAIAAKANLAISIHSTPGVINQVWPQRVGTYRSYGDNKIVITNAEVAATSQKYSDIFARTRQAAEGYAISQDPGNTLQADSFSRGDIPSKGNVSLVQLWGQTIPWVYNEIGQDGSGGSLTKELKQKYADGLIKGVEESLPLSNGSGSSYACARNAQGLIGKLLYYAWPTYRGETKGSRPPEMTGWTEAWQAARSAGKYVGGTNYPGIDCGGFVTNLLIDSGFEPNYNYSGLYSQGAGNTAAQISWLRNNWNNLGKANNIDPATLQPGDVAIYSSGDGGHTFVYVGEVAGFNSKVASASLDARAPMAGQDKITDEKFEWFRKK